MAKNSKDPRKKSRRSFTSSALTAVALAPFASLPSSEKGAAQKSPRPLQSSPITVGGGGSVGIDFKTAIPGDFLHKLWLIDKYGALEDITPGDINCKIIIHCKKGNSPSEITITGNPLAIKFTKANFPKKRPDDGKKEIHHNLKYKIVKIEVRDKDGGLISSHDAPTKGKCTLVVVNSL